MRKSLILLAAATLTTLVSSVHVQKRKYKITSVESEIDIVQPPYLACTPYEKWNYELRECVCYICPVECPLGTTWSNDACDCKRCEDPDCVNEGCGAPEPCPPKECPSPYQKWDEEACECVCYICPTECPAGTTWSNDACDCVRCADTENCPNNGCGPVVEPCPEKECPSPFMKWDKEACECYCYICPTECPAGTTWIGERCDCVRCADPDNCPNNPCSPVNCIEEECSPYEKWDPVACDCVCYECPLECPEGTNWSNEACDCVKCPFPDRCFNNGCKPDIDPCPPKECPSPYMKFDERACTCICFVCPTECPRGTFWSNDYCNCIRCENPDICPQEKCNL